MLIIMMVPATHNSASGIFSINTYGDSLSIASNDLENAFVEHDQVLTRMTQYIHDKDLSEITTFEFISLDNLTENTVKTRIATQTSA